MNHAEPRQGKSRLGFLPAAAMIVCNLFLLFCMVGLGVSAMYGRGLGILTLSQDSNQEIVRHYLAERFDPDTYRVCEWYAPEPIDPGRAGLTGNLPEKTDAVGYAQRVKLTVYGSQGAKQLDTIYWVQNGKVTRTIQADRARATL